MATKTEDRKIYEPEEIKETPLPEAVIWEEIVDAPQSLAELSSTDGAALEAATTAITGLGDLAYEDLVNELNIAAGAVTNAKIAVNAIQGDVIAASAITTVKISDNAIEAAKIAAGAVIAGKLAANSVVASNIQAGTITATQIAASTITADRMNVSSLSAISANIGTVTAGAINGLTITGGTIRTAASGTRVELSGSANEINIYSGSTLRAKGYQQGWEWYNPSGVLVGEIYADSSNNLLLASNLVSTGKLFYGVGSSGTHSMHVGTSGSTLRFFIDTDTITIGDADNFDLDLEIYALATFNHEKGFRTPTVGRVSSGGVLNGGGAAWSSTQDATGVYTVTHSIGSSGYSVVATVESATGDLKCKIGNRGTNSFTVRVDSAGTLTDAAFDFILMYY